MDILDAKSEVEKRHPLAVLADEVKLIVKRESTIFSPELCRWCPEAGVLPFMLLHQYYGKRLVQPSSSLMTIVFLFFFYKVFMQDVSLLKKKNSYSVSDLFGF